MKKNPKWLKYIIRWGKTKYKLNEKVKFGNINSYTFSIKKKSGSIKWNLVGRKQCRNSWRLGKNWKSNNEYNFMKENKMVERRRNQRINF